MNPNMLKQWLEMYDQQGLGSPRYVNAPHGAISQLGAVPVEGSNNAARMQWAMARAGEQANQPPEFFGGGQGGNALQPFVRAERFAGQMPQAPEAYDPMRDQTRNYLSRLLGGRNGQR